MRTRVITAFLALLMVMPVLLSGGPGTWAQSGSDAGEWTRQTGTLPPDTEQLFVDPGSASKLYAFGGQSLSTSTDAGATWSLCSRDTRFVTISAPGKSQTGTATLYETGPSGPRQSTDGCATWKDIPGNGINPSSAGVRWISTYPDNSSVLYAGMGGLGGLYRSTDAGATWQAASRGLPAGAWVTALTSDPRKPEHIFVGLQYASSDHPPAYVYASSDGGLTWRSASLGMHLLPNNGGKITGLTWSGNTLLAATGFDGLYASTDRGASWTEATLPRAEKARTLASIAGSLPGKPMPLGIRSLAATEDGSIVINTPEGAFASTDGAQSWQSFQPGGSGNDLLVGLDPAGGGAVLASANGLWSAKVPSASPVAAVPTATVPAVSQELATPPPPPQLPTATPAMPTPTSPPTATQTPTPPTRPPGWLPSDPAQPADPSIAVYFKETSHNVKYGFRDYWFNNDGIHLLGYPLTEEFQENGVTVQYFERARLEYQDGQVVRGLLGAEMIKGLFFRPVKFFPSEDNDIYFGPTQHSISGPFLTFWRDNGRFDTFGYPLSESFNEDGSDYQWFERARLEWHPWFPEGQRIMLGSIGTEYLKKRGWIK